MVTAATIWQDLQRDVWIHAQVIAADLVLVLYAEMLGFESDCPYALIYGVFGLSPHFPAIQLGVGNDRHRAIAAMSFRGKIRGHPAAATLQTGRSWGYLRKTKCENAGILDVLFSISVPSRRASTINHLRFFPVYLLRYRSVCN
jgi:hypothetical protein